MIAPSGNCIFMFPIVWSTSPGSSMVYFRNMKMVFPVVRLCLTIPPPPVCYSEYSDISDYWISTYCLTNTEKSYTYTLQATHLKGKEILNWETGCLLPAGRLVWRDGGRRGEELSECKQKLNLKLWSLLRRIMMRRKYQHELQSANHPNNITILLQILDFQ